MTGVHVGFLDSILNRIPLYSLGFGWIVPAVVGFIIGLIIYPRMKKTNA